MTLKYVILRSAAVAMCVLLVSAGSAFGQILDTMHQGLEDLHAGKYSEAQGYFEKVLKGNPKNVSAHYCLAVCYHYQHQYESAVREYSWVCKNTTQPDMARRAKKGWSSCYEASQSVGSSIAPDASAFGAGSGFDTGGGGEGVAAPSMTMGQSIASKMAAGGGGNALAANAEVQPAPVAEDSSWTGGAGGRPKIIDIYTDWCGPCKMFEPIFKEAQSKYAGKIDFERINAEGAGNQWVHDRYHVTGYPTLVFIDSKGNVVNSIAGAPGSLAAFEVSIAQYLKGK